MSRLRLFERRLQELGLEPPSVRVAATLIVAGTAVIVVVGALLMWVLDHREYPNIGRSLWWAAQTVTTVGYGDVTPTSAIGRLIATGVMFWGVAFLAILTASIASTFVTARQRTAEAASAEVEAADAVRMDDVLARLERIEELLSKLANG
jgi:voltage-gated potassium channel Kch